MSRVQICEASNCQSFQWPEESLRFRDWWAEMLAGSSQDYVTNCETDLLLCRVDDNFLPATVNSQQLDNSYVCSPYTGVIRYPLEELRKVNSRPIRFGLAGLIHSMAPLLRAAQLNQVVCVNNWMLSTSLYPGWNGCGIEELVGELVQRYPNHAILFRSLNEKSNPELCKMLPQHGFLLAPSRQVYIFDIENENYLRKQNCKWDMRLLNRDTEYEQIPHEQLQIADFERIKQLYDKLYLEKYTPLNPQFSVRLLRCWWESGAIHMIGLRGPNGQLDGIVGEFQRQQTLTAPLVGYDTSLPQPLGLYRMLMAIVLQRAAQKKQLLNLSSGAASFKRLRGGRPYIEYTAVYCRHLSAKRRAVWKVLAGLLTHVGARVLRKFKL